MKWIFSIFAGLVLLGLAAYVTGLLIPANQTHVRTITLLQPPDKIFALLTDIPNMPRWNRSLEKVEILPSENGKEVSRQIFKGGMIMTITTAESNPPNHLVRAMGDSGGPFLGSWTYDISPNGNGSTIVLTEHSTFRNPLFRVMAQLFGPTKYMDEHLGDIAANFGEKTTIR